MVIVLCTRLKPTWLQIIVSQYISNTYVGKRPKDYRLHLILPLVLQFYSERVFEDTIFEEATYCWIELWEYLI
jgi:hypothetical protein